MEFSRTANCRHSRPLKMRPSSHNRASPAPAYTTVHLLAAPMPQKSPRQKEGQGTDVRKQGTGRHGQPAVHEVVRSPG